MLGLPPMDEIAESEPAPKRVRRHGLVTRIWHWLNALAVFAMIGSGLMIFNAHPRLYWGQYGANFDHAWLELPRFPGWATIPSAYSLSTARHWHLFFALVLAFALLAFMIASLINRHIQRDLRVRRAELAPRHLSADLKAHLAFRFHDPERPAAYNIFQKLSYVGVIFVLLPLLIFSGLALSPGMDAAWPWLTDIFGGRQSARSIHFIAMAALVLFIVVHLALVILAGPINEIRSMITGWWDVPGDES
jgi:Ni/Fe-hydrogenase b-type cytochrome subunit